MDREEQLRHRSIGNQTNYSVDELIGDAAINGRAVVSPAGAISGTAGTWRPAWWPLASDPPPTTHEAAGCSPAGLLCWPRGPEQRRAMAGVSVVGRKSLPRWISGLGPEEDDDDDTEESCMPRRALARGRGCLPGPPLARAHEDRVSSCAVMDPNKITARTNSDR